MSNVPLPRPGPIGLIQYAGVDMLQYAGAVSASKDAEIERLRAEVAGLREDAERYRHMRNNSQFQSRNGPGLYWYLPRYGRGDEGEQLDAAIDAARKGEA